MFMFRENGFRGTERLAINFSEYNAASLLRQRNLKTQLYFLRLGPLSTLFRQENGAFPKRSSNRRKLKIPALRFRMDGKNCKRSLSKTMASR